LQSESVAVPGGSAAINAAPSASPRRQSHSPSPVRSPSRGNYNGTNSDTDGNAAERSRKASNTDVLVDGSPLDDIMRKSLGEGLGDELQDGPVPLILDADDLYAQIQGKIARHAGNGGHGDQGHVVYINRERNRR
jgi:hypothetical protein